MLVVQVADCLALIMTVQNLEPLNNPPTPTAIAPPLSGRLSFSHTQLTGERCGMHIALTSRHSVFFFFFLFRIAQTRKK